MAGNRNLYSPLPLSSCVSGYCKYDPRRVRRTSPSSSTVACAVAAISSRPWRWARRRVKRLRAYGSRVRRTVVVLHVVHNILSNKDETNKHISTEQQLYPKVQACDSLPSLWLFLSFLLLPLLFLEDGVQEQNTCIPTPHVEPEQAVGVGRPVLYSLASYGMKLGPQLKGYHK